MDDVISRQAALAEVHESVFEFFDICDDDEELPMTLKDEQLLELNKTITTRIKNLPTAEPKKGKWIRTIGMVKCDQCLRAIRRIDCDGLLNFCPNCGAQMEERE